MSALSFERRRELALHILTHGQRLNRRSGSFCGQLIADPTPMSPAQADWFGHLATAAGLDLDGGDL